MISIIDCTKLALFVYHSPEDAKLLKNFVRTQSPMSTDYFKPKNYEQDGFYEVQLDKHVQNQYKLDFYASYFVKVENRRAAYSVIAIRGTVPGIVGNDTADIKSWWKTVIDENNNPIEPDYYVHKAMSFYRKMREYQTEILNIAPLDTFVTGHSLGGAVAALLPTKCGALARAVTFNAPGIAGMQGVRDRWDFVVNFRAQHDFVSAIGKPIGNQLSIKVPDRNLEASMAFNYATEHDLLIDSRFDFLGDFVQSTAFAASVLQQHSMDNLLVALENAKDTDVNAYNPIQPYFKMPLRQFDSPFQLKTAA